MLRGKIGKLKCCTVNMLFFNLKGKIIPCPTLFSLLAHVLYPNTGELSWTQNHGIFEAKNRGISRVAPAYSTILGVSQKAVTQRVVKLGLQ